MPDVKWGEAVRALIVLHDGQQPDEIKVSAYCQEILAGFKRLRSVLFIADAAMPRTGTGKILHRKLRE